MNIIKNTNSHSKVTQRKKPIISSLETSDEQKRIGGSKWLIIAFISIIFLCFLGLYFKGKIPYETFDSKKWKNWQETETTLTMRWDMMNSLRNNHQLIGKSKKVIIDLLGKPTSSTNSEFSYFLGHTGNGINTGSLEIEFDVNDVVQGSQVLES